MDENSRADILGKIAQLVGDGLAHEARLELQSKSRLELKRDYSGRGELDPAAVIQLFKVRVTECGASVRETSKPEVPQTIADLLAERGKRRILIPRGIPEEWIPGTVDPVREAELTNQEIDRCDGVLTECSLALAVTGTIILTGAAGEGPRRFTLLPDYHLCVVRQDQVRETVPEGIRELIAVRTKPITLFSGPSGTVDIEMTKVKGVHGPRTVDVLLVRAVG